jgi:hypothetical protein
LDTAVAGGREGTRGGGAGAAGAGRRRPGLERQLRPDAAVAGGHEAVVKVLLARDDVDPDFKDNYGRKPLLWAAKNGHGAVVKPLAERDDAEVDSKH